MTSQNIQQNLDNRRYNLNISSIHLNSLSNRQETTKDTNSLINSNSSAENNGILQINVQERNFIFAEHNNENVEGNEDERINDFDTNIINNNKTN